MLFRSLEIIDELLDEEQLLGDLNQDGILNILDVVLIVNIILFDTTYNQLADLNQDNGINVLDIVILISMILDR